MQFVVAIVLLIVILAIGASFAGLMIKVLKLIGLVLLAVFGGIPYLFAMATHGVSKWMRASWLGDFLLGTVALVSSIGFALLNEPLAMAAFGLSLLMSVASMIARAVSWSRTRKISWQEILDAQAAQYDLLGHVACWTTGIACLAIFAWKLKLTGEFQVGLVLGSVYWVATVAIQGFGIARFLQVASLVNALEADVPRRQGDHLRTLIARLTESHVALGDDVEMLVKYHVAYATLEGRLIEVELNGMRRLYCANWYHKQTTLVASSFVPGVRYKDEHMTELLSHYLSLSFSDGIDLLSVHVCVGQRRQFDDGHFFVPHISSDYLVSCAGCGLAQWTAHLEKASNQAAWYCCNLCEQTDKRCIDIHHQEPERFVSDAIANGFSLVAGTDAWRENHKVFATGGQGHGFAAEKGNTFLDRFRGKSASVTGSDNAKNGADRLVDGTPMQTKYCKTALKSVNAAFDGDRGQYRYYNSDKSIMKLEVPTDQYDKAVDSMAEKIRRGQVPGVSDPAEAKNIVVKGHLTYDQAANITKFGRIESLAFDMAEGAVVGVGAASISFLLTSVLIYLRNGNAEDAIQAAAIQAAKAGLLTAGTYVAIQQIHRIAPVQAVLNKISVSWIPPTFRDLLKSGMGVDSSNALSRALGGSAVSSVVSIAIATGPDLYRTIRGEITTARLKRTFVTAAAATAGAGVGAVAGGVAGSQLGPVGAFIGRLGGATVVAWAATKVTELAFAPQREREYVMANGYFQAHLEYIAWTFSLTDRELHLVVRNFLKASNESTHQKILANKHDGRAYINSVLKPIVVGVVKQRDFLSIKAIVCAS